MQAYIGPTQPNCVAMSTEFDTGASPNLIRADMLPYSTIAELDRNRQVVNLASDSKHRLTTLGIVSLTIRIGSFMTRQPFVVCRHLGADAILGCTFIDTHTEAIWVRRRVVVLNNGAELPIHR